MKSLLGWNLEPAWQQHKMIAMKKRREMLQGTDTENTLQ